MQRRHAGGRAHPAQTHSGRGTCLNGASGGRDPLDMLRAMRGHVRHLHVLDWTADGKLCLPGRGVFDWQQFARVLREDGFDGAVILEPYAQLVESEQALLESIRFLRGVFGAPAQM
ncbi:MAG: sugar phosphate isomerase/epimerase family protein [Christensenellales bacterium]